ncbi:MAG TPA: molybdate ABC transporter substrate-binding protein [Candidatus Acidoferrum sp.]|nr:molybdate ABC transporter substrate-binding protein [Candidatus Acidoferrum sp.]
MYLSKSRGLFCFLLAIGLGTAGGPAAGPSAAAKTELTVSAAISLKDVLDEIQTAFLAADPTIALRFNLGASGTLQRQIEQGAPVDVFISASTEQMDALASKGFIFPETRKDLVKNSVVLITPEQTHGVSSFPDLLHPSVRIIAIGDPQTVPAGKYAREVLIHFGLYDKLKPKFVFAKDVRQVLTYVETGNADAGIVYATDARASKTVSVVATAPDNSHSPVVYPVAVVAGSRNSAAAKTFVDFLLGSKAAAIFEKYGFASAGR